MARVKMIRGLVAALLAAPLLLGAAPPAQLAQAVAAQRHLVAQQPDSGAALNDLGNLLVETGELEEAEEVYRRAMSLEPGRPEPAFNLALLLTATNHRREARRLLKKLVDEHPKHAWGYYQLGTLQQAAGDRSRALRSYREAFRIDPSLSDPRRNPHVLDNSLATAAMLEAFAKIGQASTGQRLYVEPSRITGLLLPPLTAEPGEAATETGEAATETGEAPAETEAKGLVAEPVTKPPDG